MDYTTPTQTPVQSPVTNQMPPTMPPTGMIPPQAPLPEKESHIGALIASIIIILIIVAGGIYLWGKKVVELQSDEDVTEQTMTREEAEIQNIEAELQAENIDDFSDIEADLQAIEGTQ